MKKVSLLIIILIALFKADSSNAQIKMGVSYIFSDITSNNLGIMASVDIKKKHQFSLGLKYHYNDDTTKPLFRYYYRNLYSEKLWQNFLGFIFEYRLFLNKHKTFRPYLFYNFQYSRLGSKFKSIYFTGDNPQLREKPVTLDPINFYENHIGLGLNININPIVTYSIGFSGGGTFFTDMRDLDDLNKGTATQGFVGSRLEEFSWLFNTGFTFNFKKKETKKKK